MISGTFQFGGDDIEIWEDGLNIKIKQDSLDGQRENIITIPKDAFEMFTEWLGIKAASDGDLPLEDWIKAIDSDGVGLSTWEKDFMESITRRVASHGIVGLSEKQRAIIKRIYEDKVK